MSVSILSALMLSAVQAASAPVEHAAPAPVVLAGRAETVRRYASDARQGVAVGPDAVYAVSNWSIVRYDKASGEKQAEWAGDRARFPHINACNLIAAELVCASSNFPATPHVSTVEVFDPVDLHHKRSVALGMGTGSITWVDRHDGSWWAMFANYDGRGGEAPRSSPHHPGSFRRPVATAGGMGPAALDPGADRADEHLRRRLGPDGRLYLTGHDLPELYVVALPMGGGVLDHIETLGIEAEGQAVDWDETQPGMLYGITRRTREILAMKAPISSR